MGHVSFRIYIYIYYCLLVGELEECHMLGSNFPINSQWMGMVVKPVVGVDMPVIRMCDYQNIIYIYICIFVKQCWMNESNSCGTSSCYIAE